jgi:hypothetical protein
MDHRDTLTNATALEEAVEDALQIDVTLARHPVNVAVQGTTVTLSGKVGSQQAKDLATQIACGVRDVIDVINELRVVEHNAGDGRFPFSHNRHHSGASQGTGASEMMDITLLAAATSGLGGGAGTSAASNSAGIGYAGFGALAITDEHVAADWLADEISASHGEDIEEVKG